MRYKGILLVLVLSLCSLFLFSENARATAISDTSVTLTLDWGRYTNFVWSDGPQFASNGADADLDGITDQSGFPEDPYRWVPFDSTVITETAMVTADSLGTAQTTLESASATAHSVADGIGTTTPPAENVISSADSNRGRTFSPNADGQVTFSFQYDISQDFSTEFGTETTSGYSIAQLFLSDSSAGGTPVGSDQVVFDNTGTSETGYLGFTVDLDNEHTYFLMAHVYTSAIANSPEQTSSSVPEPCTMLLLGFGMIGLAGFRRKFRKQ